MITTNDSEVAKRARLIRDHGSSQRYQHITLGYNLRMNDIQAAIGLSQLPKLKEWNARRQANAAYLTEALSNVNGIITPGIRADTEHVFHQYTIRIGNRDQCIEQLREGGIGVGVHYPIPIHHQPMYQELGYNDSLPISETASREVLSLPVHPSLTQQDLDDIIAAVSQI